MTVAERCHPWEPGASLGGGCTLLFLSRTCGGLAGAGSALTAELAPSPWFCPLAGPGPSCQSVCEPAEARQGLTSEPQAAPCCSQ